MRLLQQLGALLLTIGVLTFVVVYATASSGCDRNLATRAAPVVAPPTAAAPAKAKPAPAPTVENERFFPATKAAPVFFDHDVAPAPPQQQAVPQAAR